MSRVRGRARALALAVVVMALLLGGCLLALDFSEFDPSTEAKVIELDSGASSEATPANGSFTIALAESDVVLGRGESRKLAVKVVPVGSFASDVTITSDGPLPEGVKVGTATVKSPATGAEIELSAGASFVDGVTITIAGTSANVSSKALLTLTIIREDRFDPSYGDGGIAIVSGMGHVSSALVAADGVVYGGGSYPVTGVSPPLVAKLSPNGVLDPTFGDAGIAAVSTSSTNGPVVALAFDDTGKPVAAQSPFDSPRVSTIVRFDANGTPTPAGVFAVDAGTRYTSRNLPYVGVGGSGGRLVLAREEPEGNNSAVSRQGLAGYFIDGGRDPSLSFDAGPFAASFELAPKIVVFSDGTMVLGVQAYDTSPSGGGPLVGNAIGLRRLLASGASDSAFGDGGTALVAKAGDGGIICEYGITGSDGGYVIVGGVGVGASFNDACIDPKSVHPIIIPLSSNGATTVGDGGAVELPFPYGIATAVAVDVSGRIVVVGNLSRVGEKAGAFIVRLLPNGSIDPSLRSIDFPVGAKIVHPETYALRALAVGLAGRFIYVAGVTVGKDELWVARYFQ